MSSCTAFEYSERNGGCELHKSHITKYESDDGVKCWCDTSICGTKSVGDEDIGKNTGTSGGEGEEEDSPPTRTIIVLIIIVVIAVFGLVGLGAAILYCCWKRGPARKPMEPTEGGAKVVGQPVQEDQVAAA